MSKLPWKKNLHLCFPNFKCLPLITQSSIDQQDHPPPNSPLKITNNTLYHHHSNSSHHSTSNSLAASDDLFSSSSSSSSSEPATDSPPDFATIFASQRFFFSSPGRSNSIVESSYTKPYSKTDSLFVTKGVTVAKFSSNPYLDFRKSMEEMLEARDRDDDHNVKNDFDYLHELLLCYLQLNPLEAHKDIISAFTDVVICMLSATASGDDDDDDQRREVKES